MALRRTLRIFAIGALTLAIAATALPNPTFADGSSYVWVNPISQATCRGGNVSGPTLAQWMQANYPGVYTALSASSQLVANNVYEGTTCTSTRVTGVSMSPGSGIDPSGSFGTSAYCPQADIQQAGGCVTAFTTINTTYNFNGSFSFMAQDALEMDEYWAASDAWSPLASSFHDNHGNSWGLAISGYQVTSTDPNNGARYVATGTEASGNANFQWLVLTCTFIACGPDVATSASNFQTETAHVGYEATLNRTLNGSTGSGNYCFFTDYTVASASDVGGGWCASP